MIKEAVLHSFWSSFGIPAYDENSVPQGAVLPYITYDVITDNLGTDCYMNGTIWYRSSSWNAITEKQHEIERYLKNGLCLPCDDGYVWIKRGNPFAQRLSEMEDRDIRRIMITIAVEYLTAL